MYRFYIYILFIILLFSSCEESIKPDSQKKSIYPPPLTTIVSNPTVTVLDTCKKPIVMVNPTKGMNNYVLSVQNGSSTVSLSPPIVDSLNEGEAIGQSFLKNYNTEQGLALSSIACSYMDKTGNLWFGTYGGGVSRYDGKSFTNITMANGLANNIIRSIIQDKAGNMWFGTNGNGVSKYDGKLFKNFNTDDGLAHNIVKSIVEDKMGNLWFGTDGGISKYNPSEKKSINEGCFTNYTEGQGLISNAIHKIIEDKRGNLWFVSGKGVSKYNPGITGKENAKIFSNYTTEQGLVNNYIYSVMEDVKGNIWFGTGSGISIYQPGLKKGSETDSFTNCFINKVGGGVVLEITEDKKGNIWFGTGKDVHKYSPSVKKELDENSFTRFGPKHGFPNYVVYNILEDKAGNLWFSTYGGGVSKYSGMSVTDFTALKGVSANKVWSITEDKAGSLWFLASGSFTAYSEKAFTYYRGQGGRCVTVDKRGDIWMGTGNGVCKYDGKSFTYYTVAQGLAPTSVSSILEDKKGNMWFGTYDGGVSRFDGKSFTNYAVAQGLASNAVKCIAEDKNGNIFIGTNGGGVSKYDGKSFVNYTTQQGLLSNIVYSIIKDKADNIWLGTAGGGLSKYDGKSFANYTKTHGLADDVVYAMVEDTANNILWCGTNSGLSGLKLNSIFLGEGEIKFENFNNTTGYPIKDVNTGALFLDSKGILWAGTGDKLVRFDYKEVNRSTEPPNVFIQALKIKDEKISWYNLKVARSEQINKDDSLAMINEEATAFGYLLTGVQRNVIRKQFEEVQFDSIVPFYPVPINLVLPYKHNNITFDFVAIETGRPQLVKYQFMLEGYDKEWNPVTDKTSASFGNMYEGTYTFKLKAQSPDGIWSEPIVYTFTVLPPWYRTWWMYLIYLLSTISAGILFFRWRTASLRRDKEKLEHVVKQRTAEVVEQKKAIEEQKMIVDEKNKDMRDSILYAKRIQDALLRDEEYVSLHLPDHFILYLPKDIVSGDFYWGIEKKYSNAESGKVEHYWYVAVVDCTGHGVPGAFMSMLGMVFLNEIISNTKVYPPAAILNELRDKVVRELGQTGKRDETQDGMDISLVRVNMETNEIQWAGANNSLNVVTNGVLTEIKADKQPIGYYPEPKPFTNHTLQLKKGDYIYMFSDGYADQFGGPKGKKFKYKQLEQLIVSNSNLPMYQQKMVLKKVFNEWKGELEQMDDVCVIGIKL